MRERNACRIALGRKEKLVKYYEELLKKSNSGNDRFDYGCWSFNNKLFKIAHKYLIHRFYKETNATKYPNINDRLWNGKESISDKTLLIRYEQGFNDTVMFSRFVPLVKNSAKKLSEFSILSRITDGLT